MASFRSKDFYFAKKKIAVVICLQRRRLFQVEQLLIGQGGPPIIWLFPLIKFEETHWYNNKLKGTEDLFCSLEVN